MGAHSWPSSKCGVNGDALVYCSLQAAVSALSWCMSMFSCADLRYYLRTPFI